MDSRVAVLFCDPKGVYSGIGGLDLWGADRDARLYQGPYPVVAHPPCARWCRLAKLVASQGGKPVGEDDGCFASALASVRRWGGVLEHPAHSLAWGAYDLPKPVRGAWVRGTCGGWVCEVDQSHYGHRAQKSTWLYAIGACYLPTLQWAKKAGEITVTTTRAVNGKRAEFTRKGERSATPVPFAEILLDIAKSVRVILS